MAPLFKSKPVPPRGESFVWLTAMGLAVGVTMVIGLLSLIVVHGLSVFWPQRVVELQLKDGSRIAGEITREQIATDGSRELQLHTGNKDASGMAYRFVSEAAITTRSQPADIMVLERIEYGNAIVTPVALDAKQHGSIPASDARLASTLRQLVTEAAHRRAEIEEIEKSRIGTVNRKLTANEQATRALDRDEKLDAAARDAKKNSITESSAALQKQYETLAAEAKRLREQQKENTLRFKLADGTERTQAVGDIVRFYFPNQLSLSERFGIFFSHIREFLTTDPREANTEGGIFPAIFGTFVMTLLMSVLVTPFGVIAAIYLREYAKQGFIVRAVRISVNNLAGVPSIVFGVFGLGFFIYLIGAQVDRWFFSDSLPTPTFGTGGIFWASLTLALLTLPVIIVATEEALVAVPRGIREAALATGASKWQTIQRVVLPSATPGILTGVVLAMARGAGEVAPLMLVGVVKLAPSLPLDSVAPFFHLDRKFMHLGFHIFDLGFQSPDSDAAKPMVFATALLLIALVVVMNLTAILLRNRLRKKYALGTF